MHPVLARYLDAEVVRDVLRRKDAGEDVGPEHAALLEAASSFSSERRAVTRASNKRMDSTAQQAALFLATHAALRALRASPELGPELSRVEGELRALEAEPSDIDALLAQVVADEAFGTDQDPGEFDATWFKETLNDLPRLTALDEERVQAMLVAFAGSKPAAERALAERVSRELLEAAWSEGATPISVEHVEDALDSLTESFDEDEFPKAALLLAGFVEFLAGEKLVGPERARRLTNTIRNAAAAVEGGDA